MTDILFITKKFIIEPLGIGYLSAGLKSRGLTTDLLQIERDVDVISYLKKCVPKIICYSVWTGSQDFFYKLNRRLKLNFKFTSIFGGAHATFSTHDLLSRIDIDYVIKGEADLALPELCESIIEGTVKSEKLVSIKKPPQDLNELCEPDRELLYKYKHNRVNPIRSILSSRGCPFACTFCYNEKFSEIFEGKKIRFRDMWFVLDEAARIKRHYPETRFFFFQDDEVGARVERLEYLAKQWKQFIRIPFHVQMRVEYIDDERIKLLKMAGCNSLTFAIESADYDTRRNVLGKKFKNLQIENAVKLLYKYKMKFRVENMIGIPFCDTVEDMWKTYKYNMEIKPKLSWVSLCQPYPETSLGTRCKEADLFSGDLKEIPEAFFSKTILRFPKKVKLQLENMQKLFTLFIGFRIPKWLAKIIININLGRVYGYVGKIYKKRCFRKLYEL